MEIFTLYASWLQLRMLSTCRGGGTQYIREDVLSPSGDVQYIKGIRDRRERIS